ncbi:MAG: DUF2259 domain-containing protein [Treponema sp.]|nr:DUF2259 domain-containing protein [Treponema sp.]
MKKIAVGGMLFMLCAALAGAGDAAFFVDTGFSADGSVYIFGQYGQTDGSYQGWAEIYTVDVKENVYVPGEVYITKPSVRTARRAGKDVYTALVPRSAQTIARYAPSPAAPEQILYISGDESKAGTDEIIFTDFSAAREQQGTYRVQLLPTVTGTGRNVASSFVIMLEKRDAAGTVLGRQRIGTPAVIRKGVAGYRIQKILCDRSGKSIIFVVEKIINDTSGISIRYMVEAAVLDAGLQVTMQ